MQHSGYFIIARIPECTQYIRNRYMASYRQYMDILSFKRLKNKAKISRSKMHTVYTPEGMEYCLWFLPYSKGYTKLKNGKIYELDSAFELNDVTDWATKKFDLSIYGSPTNPIEIAVGKKRSKFKYLSQNKTFGEKVK